MPLKTLVSYLLIMDCLIGSGVPFELSFTPGTRKDAETLQLTIHISPKSALTIQLE